MRFTFLGGKDPGRTVEVKGKVARIGAAPTNDVTFAPADAAHVASVHAKVILDGGRYWIHDNEDEYGTFRNGERVQRAALEAGDELRFGDLGPVVRFEPGEPEPAASPAAPAGARPQSDDPLGALLAAPPPSTSASARWAGDASTVRGSLADILGPETLPFRRGELRPLASAALTIGRARACDLILDHPQVSALHARIVREGDGRHAIVDETSLNGTFVGPERVSGRRPLAPNDPIHVGPFLLLYTGDAVAVHDERQETEVVAAHVGRIVSGGGPRLLDDVSLRIPPGELVGLIGPSGAGKSTLLGTLNGLRPATEGRVLVNGLDLYECYELLKSNIGFVPQDDIVHVELTPGRTLEYVSLLRLPADTSGDERARRIGEVLSLLELADRKDIQVARLSGGQRKRVSIGVELLTEPSLIFLDEPTAGLDPALEAKMMVLFKELARQGKTVVVTTHLMESVDLFDKLVVLVRGKLAFYGTPAEARAHFGIPDMRDLYAKLATATPAEWAARYIGTPAHARHVGAVAETAAGDDRPAAFRAALRRSRAAGSWIKAPLRQLAILTRRYLEILLRDRKNTLLLLLQAPIVGAFVALAMDSPSFILFMLALSAIWFGTNNAAKEIVKELPIYRRERRVNLGLAPYVLSKVAVLAGLAVIQCFLLLAVVVIFRPLPGSLAGIYGALLLSALAGALCGLAISALADTTDKATGLVPMVLIPQVLFAGLFTELTGVTGAVGMVMPARWSYDLLKRAVMATHEEPVPPLVDFAEKEQAEKELGVLADRSRAAVAAVDARAAEGAGARARVDESWRAIDAEVRVLGGHRDALRESYVRADEYLGLIERKTLAIHEALARQRAVGEEMQVELRDLAAALEGGAGKPPDPEAAMRRVTPDWIAVKRKRFEEAAADYRTIEKLAGDIEVLKQALIEEKLAAEARKDDLLRSEKALLQARADLETEVATLTRLAREVFALEEALKADARRIQQIQDDLTVNLRERKYVYLHPRDSVALDVGALAGFCAVFFAATIALVRRRDRDA
jgi:ABC-type multidrug transport system ATPase subunit